MGSAIRNDVREQLKRLEVDIELNVYRSLIDDADRRIVGLIEGNPYDYEWDPVFDRVKREIRYPDRELRGFIGDALYTIWIHRKIGPVNSLAIAELLIDRFRVTDEVRALKMAAGRETYDPAREEKHTADLCTEYPDRGEVIIDLYNRIYEYSRFRQDANRGFS